MQEIKDTLDKDALYRCLTSCYEMCQVGLRSLTRSLNVDSTLLNQPTCCEADSSLVRSLLSSSSLRSDALICPAVHEHYVHRKYRSI